MHTFFLGKEGRMPNMYDPNTKAKAIRLLA
jgi:hypothetical protein